MNEPAMHPQTAILLYWAIIVLIAAFCLRMACGLCRTSLPSWQRAIVSVMMVTLLAYLAADFTAYCVLRSMDGVLIQIPPWYSYNFWFREPPAFKLYVLSFAGIFRYAPLAVALFVAGFLQVIVLDAEVKFLVGLFIYLLTAFATVIAGYIVSLLFGMWLNSPGVPPPEPGVAQTATGPPQGAPAANQQTAPRTGSKRQQPPPPATAPGAPPQGADQGQAANESLQVIQDKVKDHLGASQEYAENAGKAFKVYADSHLEELKKELAPFTRHLPAPVEKYLDEGGWWVVLGVCALIALFWLGSIVGRLRRGRRRGRKKKKVRSKEVPLRLKEDLTTIGEAYTEEGSRRLAVKGLTCRLRLVVLSLGNRNPGGLSEDMVDRVLDWIKPGLAEVVAEDYPRVRIWPPFYNAGGFASGFVANVPIPEAKGTRSHWILVAGQVKLGLSIVNVGLALHADEANTLRNITVTGERWLDVLSVKGPKVARSGR